LESDSEFAGSASTFRAKLVFATVTFREPALVSDILCRCGSVEPSAGERFFDVLAPAGERHHLLARISLKLPSAIGSGHLYCVSEALCVARQFGPIDRGCEALRAIDLDRIEAAPRAIWA